MSKEALLAKYGAESVEQLVARAGDLADGKDGKGEAPDAAMAIYSDVLLEFPDHLGALYGSALILRETGRYMLAIQFGKRIAAVCPTDPRGWKIQATTYGMMSRYEDSMRFSEKALSCARTDFTLADYAYAACNAGEWDAAYSAAVAALEMAESEPKWGLPKEATANARVTKAYCDLARGNWVEGFAGFRHTMRTKFRKEREYPLPNGGVTVEWQGEPDAVVVVTGEQGLGDEVMAASVVPDALCKKFIFDCDHRLAPLFARSFPSALVLPQRRSEQLRLPRGAPLPTHHKTLFGLGELFRKRDEDFPRKPFLIPNHAYVDMFREYFGGQRVIGLAWSGGLPRTAAEHRTAGLRAFLPLLRRGGAEFVSLQYGDDAQEVAEMARDEGITVRRLPWVTRAHEAQDIDLLGGLLAACSEVIGVHTSALHIAAAMGVPTTFLTHRGSGWRYAPDRLWWYPETATMHKKKTGESWRECIARLVEERK